jgi:hypothetical protein
MSTDERMLGRHRFPTDNTISLAAELCLLKSGMNCFKSVKPLLESWRKTLVCFYVVNESCVTSHFRCIENDQERRPRWLFLISHVRVPSYTAVSVRQKRLELSIAAVSVNQVDLWIAFRGTTGRMTSRYVN